MPLEAFNARHGEFPELLRELLLLRAHNKQFRTGDSQATLLLFSEASMVLVALERWLRMVLRCPHDDERTLFNLLEDATANRWQLLPYMDRVDAIKRVSQVRNTIQHANYEQAAQEAGLAHYRDWFRDQFASEIESLFRLLWRLIKQIDPTTGLPKWRLRFVDGFARRAPRWTPSADELRDAAESPGFHHFVRFRFVSALASKLPAQWRRDPRFM
jgi:hypothetical protein